MESEPRVNAPRAQGGVSIDEQCVFLMICRFALICRIYIYICLLDVLYFTPGSFCIGSCCSYENKPQHVDEFVQDLL